MTSPRRLAIAALLLSFVAMTAQARQENCDTDTSAGKAVKSLPATIARMQSDQSQRINAMKEKIDGIEKEMLDSGRWTVQQKSDFFSNIVKSPAFVDLQERLKQEIRVFSDLANGFPALQKSSSIKKACQGGNSMLASSARIGALYDQQFSMMYESAKTAAEK